MARPTLVETNQIMVGEGSLTYVVYLTHFAFGIRYFSLLMGIAFALWVGSALTLQEKPLTVALVAQLSLFSLICPVLIWVGSRWVEQVAKNVLTSNRNLIAANVVSQQALAEWQQAEAARSRSEDRFRDLVENCSDIVWEIDNNFAYTYCSPNVYTITGYTAEEFLGKTPLEFMPPEDALRVSNILGDLVTRAMPFKLLTHLMIYKDGSTGVMECSGSPVFDEHGNLKGYRGMDRDITSRKQVEEQVRTLSCAVDQSPFGVIITDVGGNTVYVNPAYSQITGYASEQAIGRPIEELNPTDAPSPEYLNRWEQISGEKEWRGQLHKRKKNGDLYWCSESVFAVRDQDRNITNFITIQEDVTEKKAMEEQLQQSQKMESIGRLAAGVAHDFNNLLTATLGYSQLAMMALSPDHPVTAHLQEIVAATERAANLTRQLLTFSRSQMNMPTVLRLNDLILNLDRMLRRLIGTDIELVVLPDSDLNLVKADPGQLEMVLVNLVVNARDSMPDGGKLTISTTNTTLGNEASKVHPDAIRGEYVTLEVSDNGSGIPRDVIDHIFEPFFTTKEVGQGTGLGLASCYGTIKQCGGFIRVESVVDEGTTFQIYLPRTDEAIDAVDRGEQPTPFPKGTERILLVDDEPLIQSVISEMLRLQGYVVLEAANGEEALRVVQEHAEEEIHALLTDMVMPQMGGKDLAYNLLKTRPNIKILIMSGYSDDFVFHKGTPTPAVTFLQKPFMLETLAQKLREVLDRKEPVRQRASETLN